MGARASCPERAPGRSESREGTEVRDGISGANPEPDVVLAVSVVDENVAEVEVPTCAKPDRCGSAPAVAVRPDGADDGCVGTGGRWWR